MYIYVSDMYTWQTPKYLRESSFGSLKTATSPWRDPLSKCMSFMGSTSNENLARSASPLFVSSPKKQGVTNPFKKSSNKSKSHAQNNLCDFQKTWNASLLENSHCQRVNIAAFLFSNTPRLHRLGLVCCTRAMADDSRPAAGSAL